VSGKIEAGKAVVRVEANRDRLAAGLAAAQKQLRSFAAGAAKIGAGGLAGAAAVLAPLTAAVKHFADTGSQLDDMSQRTGASVEALSGLGYAAKMSGAELADVEKGLRAMQKGLAAGDEGFAAIGLSTDKLKGFAPEDQMRMIAEALSGIENPGDRAAAALDIFGKGGTALLPMLQNGAKGIDMLVAEADALGVVMSGKDATAAGILGDSIDKMTISAGSLVNTIGAQLAPAFTALLAVTTYSITTARDWIAANQGVVLAAAGVAAGVGLLGAGLITAAGLAYASATAVGVLGTVMSALGIQTAVVSAATTIYTAVAGVLRAITLGNVSATLAAFAANTSLAISTGAMSAATTVYNAIAGVMRAIMASNVVATIAAASAMGVVSAATTIYTAVAGVLRAITIGNIGATLASVAANTALAIATGVVTVASGIAATAKLGMAAASGVASAAFGVLTASAAVLQSVLMAGLPLAIAAVVAALVGLAGYFTYTSGVGGTAMDYLSEKFTMLSEIAGPVFKGIQDAMAGGDFTLAATILWEGLQIAWLKGTADIASTFRTALNGMMGVLDGWIATFRSKWNDVSGTIADMMLDLMGTFDKSFDATTAKRMRQEDTKRQNQGYAGGVKDRAAGRDAASLAAEEAGRERIAVLEQSLTESLAKAVTVAAEADQKKLDAAKYIAPDPMDYKATIDEAYKTKGPENMGTSSGFAAMLQSMSGGATMSLDQQMYTEAKVQSKLLGQIVNQMAKGAKLQKEPEFS
jgi:hypothetical protein